MKITELKQLISELINEVLSERSAQAKINKGKKNAFVQNVGQHVHSYSKGEWRAAVKGQPGMRSKLAGSNAPLSHPEGDKAMGKPSAVVPQDIRAKASKAQGGKVAFGKYYDASGTFLGSVKQGKWVSAGQQQQNKSTLEEHKMIRLRDLLTENAGMKERRIDLVKLEVLMEKMLPELTKTQAAKLTELCNEVYQLACDLNKVPYQIWNAYPEWPVLKAALTEKLVEVKEEALKITETKFDATTFIKALDEFIVD